MDNTELILTRFLKAQDRLVLQASDLSLGTIASMVDGKAINVTPDYQRRERWSPAKQSALVESFLLNVPVPPVYLAEDEYGRYSVVDGKQRITAIHAFITDKLSLMDLEAFQEIEGYKFSQLPQDLQNALQIRPYLRVITLLKQSDSTLRYEVFTRLNQGGESMKPQELRNVAFRGSLNDLIFELSGNTFLRKQLKIKNDRSAPYRVMEDAELVLRFLTLRKSWRSFSKFYRVELDRFMRDNRGLSNTDLKTLSASFNTAITMCERIWGDAAFKRPQSDSWRDQLLTGMYDAQMVAVDRLTQVELKAAVSNSSKIIERTRELFADSLFDSAVRVGTNSPNRVSYRINEIYRILTEI